MQSFVLFKSKNFISLLSLSSIQRKSQRLISNSQSIKTIIGRLYNITIYDRKHNENKDCSNLTLPAIFDERLYYREWYKNDKKHRDEKENNYTLPSCIYTNDEDISYWFKNGKSHRNERDENGLVLPAFIHSFADQKVMAWYIDGKKHRDDKINNYTLPAVEYAWGDKEWWKDGKCHRDEKDENGALLPAIIRNPEMEHFLFSNGKEKEYWINGVVQKSCIIL